MIKVYNYINPGSQIPQVEARKRCSRDLFTSSGRATALIDRHFWYTFLRQFMTRLTNTAILLSYTSCFHWRFSGNWQEHICERNIRCIGSPSHLSLGSDRLNVTVCRTCTVPLWDVQRTVRSWSCWKISLDGWRYVHQVPHISFLTYPAVPYDDLAVPDIFPSGTIGSPKNSITMMLIRHVDRCLHFHDQSRRFYGSFGCARSRPGDLTWHIYLFIHWLTAFGPRGLLFWCA